MKRARTAGIGSVDGSGETADQLREDIARTQEDLGQTTGKATGGLASGLTMGITDTAQRAKDALPPAVANAPVKAVTSAKLLVSMVGVTRILAGVGSAVVTAGAVWGVARMVRARRAARNRGLRGLARRIQRRG